MPHFMIVVIPYINLLNLSWIIKSLFLRNMKPLKTCIVGASNEYHNIRGKFNKFIELGV